MSIQKKLLYFSLIFITNWGFSQSLTKEEEGLQNCWKCFSYSNDRLSPEAKDACQIISREYKGTLAGSYADLFIARQLMAVENYKAALKELKSIAFESKNTQAMVLGLTADCYSALKLYKKAEKAYESAALFTDHLWLAPMYLFKAYLCAEELNETARAQRYVKTIQVYYQYYSDLHKIGELVNENLKEILDVNRQVVQIDPNDTLGLGSYYDIKIDPIAYEANLREDKENYVEYQDQKLDEKGHWSSYINQSMFKHEFAASGLVVSEEEFMAYIFGTHGFSVQQDIEQAFTNEETGAFDPQKLQTQVDKLKTSLTPSLQKQWAMTKEYYNDKRLLEKYTDIFKNAIFITDLEARYIERIQSTLFEVEIQSVPYSQLENSSIEVTEKEVLDYYEAHSSIYQITPLNPRKEVQLIEFELSASAADTASMLAEFEILKKEFEVCTEDSIFVITHSEIPFYYPKIIFKPESEQTQNLRVFSYPEEMQTTLKNAKIGDVIGPYISKGNIRIAKITGKVENSMTARHILIAAYPSEGPAAIKEAREKAYSLLPKITSDNFEDYVTDYSEDPGSVEKGGVYEEFLEGEMVSEFQDYAQNTPIGEIGIVQTDFGFHIMEVLERKPAFYPYLAIISKTIKVTEQSTQQVIQENQPIIDEIKSVLKNAPNDYQKVNALDALIEKNGLSARTYFIEDAHPQLDNLPLLELKLDILELAFAKNAEVGNTITIVSPESNALFVGALTYSSTSKEAALNGSYKVIEDILEKEKMRERAISTKAFESAEVEKMTIRLNSRQYTGTYAPNVVYALSQGQKGDVIKAVQGEDDIHTIKILEKRIEIDELSNPKKQMEGIQLNSYSRLIENTIFMQGQFIDNKLLYDFGIRP